MKSRKEKKRRLSAAKTRSDDDDDDDNDDDNDDNDNDDDNDDDNDRGELEGVSFIANNKSQTAPKRVSLVSVPSSMMRRGLV